MRSVSEGKAPENRSQTAEKPGLADCGTPGEAPSARRRAARALVRRTRAARARVTGSPLGSYARRLRDRLHALRWRPAPPDPSRRGLVSLPPEGLPVTIVVPIYNAYEDVERCLEALVRNTIGPARLLLIDDASPDGRIGGLLDCYGGHSNVEVLHNAENLGFTRTVNRGLAQTTGDVLLLNSDTEVTPGWLRRLALAAVSDARVGTVTAVSNNAGAFSVPERGVDNPLPLGLSKDDVGRLVARTSLRIRPETPTANGFCMYVKRALVDDIGGFDAENFPRGYGEETDFSLRALDRGWRHLIEDATFVHHRREASFGATKAEFYARAHVRISELHPRYEGLLKAFLRSPATARMRVATAEAFEHAGGRRELPRVLLVSHDVGGATALADRELMRGLAPRFECLLLTSDGGRLRLWRRGEDALAVCADWRLARPREPADLLRSHYSAIVGEVLDRYDIELVHVRHLPGQTFDLPHVAAALEIPLVVSLGDPHARRSTAHGLDDEARRAEITRAVEKAAAAVTTSSSAHAVHEHALPVLRGMRFEVIEHGCDLEQVTGVAKPPSPDAPVRILVLGDVASGEGAEYVRRLFARDAGGRLEPHFLGEVPPELRDLGVHHGVHEPDGLVQRAREIEPSFVGIFPSPADDDGHPLAEAWAAGVPVLAASTGASAGWIADRGGGWTLPMDDPAGAYRRILEIAADPDEWRRTEARATLEGLPSVADMADRYAGLYDSVLDDARAFRPAE